MTSTNESEPEIAGLSLALRSLPNCVASTSLNDWLPQLDSTPTWIPLVPAWGVTRVMPVFPNSGRYPALIESIWQSLTLKEAVEWRGKSYELTGIEVNKESLHVLQIALSLAAPQPQDLGGAIRALVFNWLATADAGLASRLQRDNCPPFTVAVQPSGSDGLVLRITLLQRELLAPLLWGLRDDLGGEILLADIPCRLGKWVDIAHKISFDALCQVPPTEVISLKFVSPTSFKQNQLIQPFPLPELVFGSLLRRWNAFAPVELQFPSLEWQSVVSAYNLKTRSQSLNGTTEIGAMGWVKYRFPDAQQARIATVLARFAEFAGVGRKTAMGMGQVRIR
ncbi:MAG TPA: CRISPR system precrRNA processing endoribonuclease RAMP protein Cas6 [Allocoleopsis sp.]